MNGGALRNIDVQDDKNVVIDVNPDLRSIEGDYEECIYEEYVEEQKCGDFFQNFNFYFTLGIIDVKSIKKCIRVNALIPKVW